MAGVAGAPLPTGRDARRAERAAPTESGSRGTSLRRIDGGKHFTPEDRPDVIAQEIRGLFVEVNAHPPANA
jgi:pimeloyl-ACP methyl ester carboxylesterase